MKKMNINIQSLVQSLADQISEDISELSDVILIGVVTRGYPLARRIAAGLKERTGSEVPVGKLDITLYRDDLSTKGNIVRLKESFMPDSIEGKIVILVDDVLFHGRTVRAAIDNILDYGRPRKIKLAILIDRNFRELPICADYLGEQIHTKYEDSIKVHLKEIDGQDEVVKL